MRKKTISGTERLSSRSTLLNEPNAWEKDLYFYAQSVHKAAKKLAGTLQLGSNPLGEFDAYPVLFMYRHATELFLRAMVLDEGGNFLPTKPDAISVSKSRSVSWLAQFVAHIITILKWEEQFRCVGVEDLSGLKAVIEEVNGIDVGHPMFRLPGDTGTTPANLIRRLDALLDLLDSTADALAAEWDLRNDAMDVENQWPNGDDFKTKIQ
jgi:hypothetical protein